MQKPDRVVGHRVVEAAARVEGVLDVAAQDRLHGPERATGDRRRRLVHAGNGGLSPSPDPGLRRPVRIDREPPHDLDVSRVVAQQQVRIRTRAPARAPAPRRPPGAGRCPARTDAASAGDPARNRSRSSAGRRRAACRHDTGARRATIRAMQDIGIVLIVVLILVLLWRGPKTLPKLARRSGAGSARHARRPRRPGRDPSRGPEGGADAAPPARHDSGRRPEPRATPPRRRHEPPAAVTPDELDGTDPPAGAGPAPDHHHDRRRRDETLADLPPRRDGLLFVGLNPSPVSVDGRPLPPGPDRPAFWRRLMRRASPRRHAESRRPTTPWSPRATGSPIDQAADPPRRGIRRGAAEGVGPLWQKVALWRPGAVVFIYKRVAEIAAGRSSQEPGVSSWASRLAAGRAS